MQAVTNLDEARARAEDRRISPRKVVSLRARVVLPDNTTLDGQAVDLSRTGIGLSSPRMLQPGQECKLLVDLSACGEEIELNIGGRVCYCREQAAGKYRAGLHFVGLDAYAARLIDQLLS
jgi:c-di-GMP-binding flagellar brake protein YcgR